MLVLRRILAILQIRVYTDIQILDRLMKSGAERLRSFSLGALKTGAKRFRLDIKTGRPEWLKPNQD